MNVAVVYRSQATLHLDGVQLANGVKVQDTTTTLVLPQVITGGIAVWPVRNAEREWKLELNVDYIGWKSVRNLDLRRRDGTIILEQPQNWKSTYAILVGTEYRWLKMDRLPGWEVAVRGGYSNLQTQVPDSTYNPAIPSADLHIISTGVGFLCKGNWIALWLSGMRKSWNRLNKGKNHRRGPVVPGVTLRTKNCRGEYWDSSRSQWVLRKYCARRRAFRPQPVSSTKGPCISPLISLRPRQRTEPEEGLRRRGRV